MLGGKDLKSLDVPGSSRQGWPKNHRCLRAEAQHAPPLGNLDHFSASKQNISNKIQHQTSGTNIRQFESQEIDVLIPTTLPVAPLM